MTHHSEFSALFFTAECRFAWVFRSRFFCKIFPDHFDSFSFILRLFSADPPVSRVVLLWSRITRDETVLGARLFLCFSSSWSKMLYTANMESHCFDSTAKLTWVLGSSMMSAVAFINWNGDFNTFMHVNILWGGGGSCTYKHLNHSPLKSWIQFVGSRGGGKGSLTSVCYGPYSTLLLPRVALKVLRSKCRTHVNQPSASLLYQHQEI